MKEEWYIFSFVSENIGFQANICFLYFIVYTESGCLKYIHFSIVFAHLINSYVKFPLKKHVTIDIRTLY